MRAFAYAYAYSSVFTLDKDKKNRKFCPAVFALMLVLCTSSLWCAWAYVSAVGVLAMVCLSLCLCCGSPRYGVLALMLVLCTSCGRPQYVCAYASAYVEVKTKLLECFLL